MRGLHMMIMLIIIIIIIIIIVIIINITIIITREGGNYDALQLEGRPTSCQSFWAIITCPIMHQPTNLTIPQGTFRQSVSIDQYF